MGEKLFHVKLAIIFHSSYWNRHKEMREKSISSHLSSFLLKHTAASGSQADRPLVCVVFVLDTYGNLYGRFLFTLSRITLQ